MNREMQIIREVNIQAEAFYEDAVALGDHAADAFQDAERPEPDSHRSQLTGLENIAESAFKVSDVLDYVKKQTARHDYWRKGFAAHTRLDEGFGERLKNYLEQKLPGRRDAVWNRIGKGENQYNDQLERQYIYLLLIRQFIRHLVVEYEYVIGLRAYEGNNGRARR